MAGLLDDPNDASASTGLLTDDERRRIQLQNLFSTLIGSGLSAVAAGGRMTDAQRAPYLMQAAAQFAGMPGNIQSQLRSEAQGKLQAQQAKVLADKSKREEEFAKTASDPNFLGQFADLSLAQQALVGAAVRAGKMDVVGHVLSSAEATKRAEGKYDVLKNRYEAQDTATQERLRIMNERLALAQQKAEGGGPWAGTGEAAQHYNILVRGTQDPSFTGTPQYAIAYDRAGKPQQSFDPQSGKVVIIPGMDMSPYPKPTFGAQGGQSGTRTAGFTTPGAPQSVPVPQQQPDMPGAPGPDFTPPPLSVQPPAGRPAVTTQAVPGMRDRTADLKPIPAPENDKLALNVSLIESVDKMLGKTMVPSDRGAGWLSRNVPGGDLIAQTLDPKGVDARATIANVSSTLLQAKSGLAVTEAEYRRLVSLLPNPSDDANTIKTKLQNVRDTWAQITADQAAQYSKDNGFVPHAGVERMLKAGRPSPEPSPGDIEAEMRRRGMLK